MEADILQPQFTDEDAARAFLEAQRWPKGPECPHCGVIGDSYRLEGKTDSKTPVRKGVWKCGACRGQFTVTVGTILEDSHIKLQKWLFAIHLLCATKKGMSAHQLHRMLGVTYKSAWFMARRIRYAMGQEPLSSKLKGIVEVDETYIGGKEKGRRGTPGPESKKTPVVHMVERSLVRDKGKVKTLPVQSVTVKNLKPILREYLASDAALNTDEAVVYYFAGKDFSSHDSVNHSEKQYVKLVDGGQKITANTVEGYFSILKRGITGVYQHVGRQHLHRYLSEFDFRYNSRDVSDAERRDMAIAEVSGKRLMYRDSR